MVTLYRSYNHTTYNRWCQATEFTWCCHSQLCVNVACVTIYGSEWVLKDHKRQPQQQQQQQQQTTLDQQHSRSTSAKIFEVEWMIGRYFMLLLYICQAYRPGRWAGFEFSTSSSEERRSSNQLCGMVRIKSNHKIQTSTTSCCCSRSNNSREGP